MKIDSCSECIHALHSGSAISMVVGFKPLKYFCNKQKAWFVDGVSNCGFFEKKEK
jgi:hypothetical protein